jgi:hypothetical protein
MTLCDPDLVWYVAYGSNLSSARFRCYLRGGRPDGGARHYPGCRDRSDPLADEPVELRGGLYFAGTSTVWGGGMAMYDPSQAGVVAGRVYLVTVGQFADVLAQETRRSPGTDLDLVPLRRTGRHRHGSGRYGTLLTVGVRDDVPMVTFTTDVGDAPPLNRPSPPYLRTMATGLRESHGWSDARIDGYLAAAPGAVPTQAGSRTPLTGAARAAPSTH